MDPVLDANDEPLPAAYQPGGHLYEAVRRGLDSPCVDPQDPATDELTAKVLAELAEANEVGSAHEGGGIAQLLRVACHDPGRFTARGENGIDRSGRECLADWEARAALLVVQDPVRARAAL